MNPLPGLDRMTRRSELAVFVSLGFAGFMMVSLVMVQLKRIAAGSDHLTAAPAADSRSISNHFRGPASAHASPSDGASGKLRSGAESGLRLLLR